MENLTFNKTIDKIKRYILYIWQLPQHLIALLLRLIYKGNDNEYNDCIVRKSVCMHGGISLGKYIIVNQGFEEINIKHEYGHSVQSKYLGWLYLIVIGLPSLLHAGLCKCKNHSYYDFPTEKWANKLGGIK